MANTGKINTTRYEDTLRDDIPTPGTNELATFTESGVLYQMDSSRTVTPLIGAGGGDVVGGARSTDNALARYDGTTGKIIQNSDITVDDNANMAGVNCVGFDITNTDTPDEGALCWSDTEGGFIGGMGGGVNLNVGMEMFLPRKAKNTSGVDISNGELVYITGGTGTNFEIDAADKSEYHTANSTIAMATEDIPNSSSGWCSTMGIVRGDALQPIDTSLAVAGDKVYLGSSGTFQFTKPSAPDAVIFVGTVMRSHATEGEIYVDISKEKIEMDRDITKDPTGFTDPDLVVITGDSSTRTVTLTGTVNAYYRGQPVADIISGYTSPAHSATTTGTYFLLYDGSTIQWVDATTIGNDFYSNLLICYAYYNSNDATWVYARECHSLMPWSTHRELHHNIGTYRRSGGTLGDYALDSTVVSDRWPSVSAALIYDEDLPTTNAVLGSGGNYTNLFLSGASGTANLNTTTSEIIPLSGNQPYYNEFTGGTWQQTLLANNYYTSVWLLALPMASDTESQKLRYIWLQGQSTTNDIEIEKALTTNSINLGELQSITPELVFIGRIIIKYTGGNWSFSYVEDITGSKSSQTSSPSGNYLSTVNTGSTLTGLGTSTSALDIDLTNDNTWTGLQSFSDVIELAEQASTPATPASGQMYIYPKIDGKAYALNDAGVEYDLTASGGGGSAPTLIDTWTTAGAKVLSGLTVGYPVYMVVDGVTTAAASPTPFVVSATGSATLTGVAGSFSLGPLGENATALFFPTATTSTVTIGTFSSVITSIKVYQ